MKNIGSKLSSQQKWYWISGWRLDKKYAALGNYLPLIHNLLFFRGLLYLLEKLLVYLNTLIQKPFNYNTEGEPLSQLQPLDRLDAPLESAFLLRTSYYKDTFFVGPISLAGGDKLFIKLYKTKEEAALEERRSKLISKVADSFFFTLRCLFRKSNLIAYEYINGTIGNLPFKSLNKLAMDMSYRQLALSEEKQTIGDFIDFRSFFALMAKHKLRSFFSESLEFDLRPLLTLKINRVLAHGDFTPWNILSDRAQRLYLIDYERTGLLFPYYDVFHLQTQQDSLRGSGSFPELLLNKVAQHSNTSLDLVLSWYLVYLLDQVQRDLELMARVSEHHWRLPRAIKVKASLLEKALVKHA